MATEQNTIKHNLFYSTAPSLDQAKNVELGMIHIHILNTKKNAK